jgi:tetratricopeptide (TPR) repeat protein
LAKAADRCGDAPLAAMARRFIGMSLLFLGEFDGAEDVLRESVALFRRMEYMDSPYTLQVLAGDCYLGEIRLRTGRTKEALDIFARCVDECEEHGLYRGLCLFCSNAALAAFDLGEEKTAREYLRKARNYFEGSEWRRANAVGLALLALFASREGREDEAGSFWESAAKLCCSLRKKSWIDACCRIRILLENELDPASPLKQRLHNSSGNSVFSICGAFEEICRKV